MSSHHQFDFGSLGGAEDRNSRSPRQQRDYAVSEDSQSEGHRSVSPVSSEERGPRYNEDRQNYAYPVSGPFAGNQAVGNRRDDADENYGGNRRAGPRPAGPPPPRPQRPDAAPFAPVYAGSESSEVNLFQDPPAPQATYTLPDDSSLGTHPSMRSDRSIYIGFDPLNGQTSSTDRNTPPAKLVAPNQRRSAPRPPRLAPSSYYSQSGVMVSPIPEESGSSRSVSLATSKHGSYASSAAIPANWAAGSSDTFSQEIEPQIINKTLQVEDEEPGLVRQASLGRKSKPTLVTTRSPSTRRKASPVASPQPPAQAETVETGKLAAPSNAPPRYTPSPVVVGSPKVVHVRGPSAGSALSKASDGSSPLTQPSMAVLRDDQLDPEKSRRSYKRKSDTRMSLAMAKELGFSANLMEEHAANLPPAEAPRAGKFKGLKRPPRLNIDAVKEAEARGSLTSLPDLIRRATKLAAHLETGRPASNAWGARGSYMDYRSSRSNKDNESLSDILASFPPPLFGRTGNSRMSHWPLPEGADGEDGDYQSQSPRPKRRCCGLPLWAFILLIVIAIMVITAAVVVPLQLVNLSKDDGRSNNNQMNAVAQCRETSPCLNGGENIATDNFCSCVCINGFTGSNCSVPDASCSNFDFGDRRGFGGSVQGIKNATIGSAIPRLLKKSEEAYKISLDPSLLLGAFSKANVSCTVQNALVSFNGRTSPTNGELRLLRRQLLTDTRPVPSSSESADFNLATATVITPTSDSPSSTTKTSSTSSAASSSSAASPTRTPAIDQDAMDFARVAVLYIAQVNGINAAGEAQLALSNSFADGVDFGNIESMNTTIQLDERTLRMPTGEVIGGLVQRVIKLVRRIIR